MNHAVFLDRDGTLIEEKHYLHRPEQVVIYPGVAAALRRLRETGFKLIVISNQSGVGRGYFTLADVEAVHRHLREELGVRVRGWTGSTWRRKRRISRAAGASPRRSFSSTRGMNLASIWGPATWWETSGLTWNAAGTGV